MSQETNVFDRGGYDAAEHPTENSTEVSHVKPAVRRTLWALVGAFGLAAWAVGLAAVDPLGLAVPLAVLAGAVAVIGLLPGQVAHGWLAVAVAVTTFTTAMTTTVTDGGAGWVLIAVDVLVALQLVVAVAALLLEPRGSADTQSHNDYEEYARYVQAYQDYAQQYGSYWPDQHPTSVAADADGHANATAAGGARGDQDAWADMQAKYAQHTSPVSQAPSEPRERRAEGGDAAHPGLPGVDRADRPYEAQGQAAPGAAPMSPGAY